MNVLSLRCVALSAVLLALFAGCGPPRLTRFTLTGTVTFRDKPVPSGEISLEPDSDRGNRGPAALVEIVDGRFRTPAGKGHVGGPHVMRIVGFNSSAIATDGSGKDRILFPQCVLHVDLPRGNSTEAFVVPEPSPGNNGR